MSGYYFTIAISIDAAAIEKIQSGERISKSKVILGENGKAVTTYPAVE